MSPQAQPRRLNVRSFSAGLRSEPAFCPRAPPVASEAAQAERTITERTVRTSYLGESACIPQESML